MVGMAVATIVPSIDDMNIAAITAARISGRFFWGSVMVLPDAPPPNPPPQAGEGSFPPSPATAGEGRGGGGRELRSGVRAFARKLLWWARRSHRKVEPMGGRRESP